MNTTRRLLALCECSVLLALSISLSFAKLWDMPMGGSITLASMLPIMLISIKYGLKWGVPTAFAYALFQLVQAIVGGDVFVWCEGGFALTVCVLFDYIIPFTALGFACVFKKLFLKKFPDLGCLLGIVLAVACRFVCHYITGVVIWGQWAEGMSPYLYSLLYNGGYLLPDLGICLAVAFFLFRFDMVRKLVGLESRSASATDVEV